MNFFCTKVIQDMSEQSGVSINENGSPVIHKGAYPATQKWGKESVWNPC
jgi:hypothetical protein